MFLSNTRPHPQRHTPPPVGACHGNGDAVTHAYAGHAVTLVYIGNAVTPACAGDAAPHAYLSHAITHALVTPHHAYIGQVGLHQYGGREKGEGGGDRGRGEMTLRLEW